MRIKAIHHSSFPIHSEIRNAVIDFSQMTASVVAIESDVVRDGRPVVGFGFNSNGRYGQEGLLTERFVPRLLAARESDLLEEDGSNFDPFKAWQVMMQNEKPGGHGERSVAVGTIDMALWDLVAKIEDRPLYSLLADRFNAGKAEETVYVYAAGGYYYPGKDNAKLADELRSYLDLGYQDVKMKIGGVSLREDLRRIEAALEVVGEGRHLAVDVNGRFDLREALACADAIEPFGLKWYEEPGDPLDYLLHHAVAQATSLPIATGENIFSMTDSRNLVRHAGLDCKRDWLQMDPVLSYGLVEYIRTLKMLESYGWLPSRCIPHGGHQFSLHIAAAFGMGGNEAYPDVFEPFGGFADGVPIDQGTIRMTDVPGIGIELKSNLYHVFKELMKG